MSCSNAKRLVEMKSWEGRAADLQTQDTGARRHKMPCVIVCVEPNEVSLQHSFQNLHTDWKRAVDLRGGEGSVQEESDLKQHMLLVPECLTRTTIMHSYGSPRVSGCCEVAKDSTCQVQCYLHLHLACPCPESRVPYTDLHINVVTICGLSGRVQEIAACRQARLVTHNSSFIVRSVYRAVLSPWSLPRNC
jgi:hypothetical protein